jgi:hypothetical protein
VRLSSGTSECTGALTLSGLSKSYKGFLGDGFRRCRYFVSVARGSKAAMTAPPLQDTSIDGNAAMMLKHWNR